MTRIHPKHHVRRRRRAPQPVNPIAEIFRILGNAFRTPDRRADYTLGPPAGLYDGYVRVLAREQQEARMLAKLRALGTDDETREALIELASSGIPAARIRDLARSYQRGQTP